ncbi:hypothetical protein ABB37_01908 [Leptomonas pyrrhocoris]|uniref:Condensin complex subunit 2 n=1 Tax=Leptomonas pyrrhocoris TaxID=157538 RepID=A0A0M9G6N2_LEPPY|nr:hypothetical protein ABB37_01908 [Leptomonas pyrrhocoris]KPA83640.1 hypothetical protein ABB37_01908 [Leptomonas pyrrhocoris]|eukprot:XP_015662079.1 hypothetical protein ABB37_01908 [Leptomonas pyrrhocoris]
MEMHTPEPRRTRNSGGGAEGVTPKAEPVSPTPASAPRAGFLRRGDNAATATTLHGALAAGPSVLLDDDAGTAVAVDASPPPSQLTQSSHSQLPPGQTRLPRQRPRFHTVQDLDVALNQAIEGKINSRNAWVSKEASDLLEGITHTIETTLDAASADDYAGFAKAATVVEGCSKVWTSRVDSTYQQSNQMVQRLLRGDDASGKAPGEDGEDGEGADENGDEAQRNKSRSRSAAAAAAAATRTLALDATEINLDSKSRTALTQTGVNAQFRAITSKFDQGNAQGLLMNNAPFGRAGNIILDVDYSLLPASVMAAGRVSGGRGSGQRGRKHTAGAEPSALTSLNGSNNDAELSADSDPTAVASRTSQHAAVEHDAAVYESVGDFPPYAGVAVTTGLDATASQSSSPLQPSSARGSLAVSQHGGAMDKLNSDPRASQMSQLDPLLLLPHTSSSASSSAIPTLEDGHRRSSFKTEPNNLGGSRAEGPVGGVDEGAEEDEDYGDWGAGGGADDDDEATPYTADHPRVEADNSDCGTPTTNTGGVTVAAAAARDLGLEARHLVSGVTEMEAMDTLFHGHTQLALEAEDPTSWCPLSEVAKNPLAAGLGRSELSRLHREHHFTQPQKQQAGPAGAAAAGGGSGMTGTESLLKSESPTSPATKRGRKERTVMFQLPDSASLHGSSGSGLVAFSTTAELLEDGALRQATTAARNITSLGKQLLLAKDAAHSVVAYTQSTVQRAKAEEAGLVLAEAPIPGKTIPSYMSYPLHTQDFFQPFSTSLTQWNLLRKSATGRLIESNAGADGTESAAAPPNTTARDGGSAGHRLGYYGSGDAVGARAYDDDDGTGHHNREGDMPVEFFPGGAELEGVDGAEAGGDYADYADVYGPDDDGNDNVAEEERRYVQEGFRSSSDARLVAQVELAAATTAAASATRGSAGSVLSSSATFSGRSSGDGGNNAGGLLADPMELLAVLDAAEATIPSQVDVVRLRQLMWEALQGHLSANQQDKAVDLTALRSEAAGAILTGAGGGEAQGTRNGVPVTTQTAVKARAQAVLNRIRRRTRAAAAAADEESSSEEDKVEKEATEKGGEDERRLPRRRSGETGVADIAVTRFSDVVRSVLPHIAAVSSTNTLSPAFFFFSVLFLANEHNVVLQSVDSLDDLRACGIARRVGE